MRTENAKFAKRSDRVVHTSVHTFWGRSFILPIPYFSRIHRCDRPLVTFLQMGTDFACKRILGPCAWLCAPIRPHELYPPAPTLRHAAPRDGRCWPSCEVRCAWRRFLRAAHLQGWGMHDQPSWVPGQREIGPPIRRCRAYGGRPLRSRTLQRGEYYTAAPLPCRISEVGFFGSGRRASRHAAPRTVPCGRPRQVR